MLTAIEADAGATLDELVAATNWQPHTTRRDHPAPPARLHPTSKGVRIAMSGTERTVIDGPFAETKELIAGFWIWQVASLDEAIDWAKRCPNPHAGGGELEIRPIFEAEDFGEAFTPELRDREERVRAETSRRRQS